MGILRPTGNHRCFRLAGRDTQIALTLAVALAIAPTAALGD
jgi:hypothetical protein